MKILGANLELPAERHCQSSQFTSKLGQIDQNSSETAPTILIFFSIALLADYSFYVKSIVTYAPTFLRYNNSVLAIVYGGPKWPKNQFKPVKQSTLKFLLYIPVCMPVHQYIDMHCPTGPMAGRNI